RSSRHFIRLGEAPLMTNLQLSSETPGGGSDRRAAQPVASATFEPFVSTLAAQSGQRRGALGMVGLAGVAGMLGGTFGKVPLAQFPAFIPAYEAALIVIDAVTAVLLFGQFVQLRSAALLALAAGYLYDALMVVSHALSFPGLIAPGGWLGGGTQTTAWLY